MIKDFKRSLNMSILLGILFLIMGIVFTIMPSSSLNVISNIIGVLLLIYGLFEIIDCFRNNIIISTLEMATGVLSLASGLIILFNNDILDVIIPFVLGIFFIASGLSKVRLSIILYQVKSNWVYTFITSLLTIICGFIMIFNPFETVLVLTVFIGIITIVYSLSSIINTILFKTKVNEIEEYFNKVLK